ncbi:Uncharacterized protein APZ42_023423 [Daphnia magna]|uniref:Uncharacterized protein n=1 Tax=Daphnia magna TaxID=35525 RepID=A0A162DHG4_9CRUS|nr:Uncharacterized protein APZ42_023423 [Daphnia magna]
MDTHKFFSFLFALAGTKEMIPCELALMFSKENRFIRRLDPSHVPPPSPYSSVWTVIRLTSCQIALLDFASFSFFLFFFFHLAFKSNRIKGKEKNVSDIFFFEKSLAQMREIQNEIMGKCEAELTKRGNLVIAYVRDSQVNVVCLKEEP